MVSGGGGAIGSDGAGSLSAIAAGMTWYTPTDVLGTASEPIMLDLESAPPTPEPQQLDVAPGPREHSETARAIASLIGQSVALARLESDTAGAGAASGMLDQFEQSLREAREKRDEAARQAATE